MHNSSFDSLLSILLGILVRSSQWAGKSTGQGIPNKEKTHSAIVNGEIVSKTVICGLQDSTL